jgi:hypothetical protein
VAYVVKFESEMSNISVTEENAREKRCVKFPTASSIKVMVVGTESLIDSIERMEKLLRS